jgi:hypothetical protein
MKSLASKVLLTCVLLAFGFAVVAGAHTRIEEVWTCTIKDGKTMEAFQAVNLKWVRFVNENVEGGDIHSSIARSGVGVQGQFVSIDSFPSMDSWTAHKALLQKAEGRELEAAFEEVSTCSSNSLYSVAEVE